MRLSKEELAEWDRQILAALTAPVRFSALCVRMGVSPSEGGGSPLWRIVDRRLQALRKRGLIQCGDGGVWRKT